MHLLNVTQSQAYLCAESNKRDIEKLVKDRPNTRVVQTPALHDWISAEGALNYEYSKSWEVANSDPWIIFHSSGTTGRACALYTLMSGQMR